MTLPKGASSGRGNTHLARPNPPRPGVVAEARERKPLAQFSARRLAEIGDGPRSTFKAKSPGPLRGEAGPGRPDVFSSLARTAGPKQSKGNRKRPGGPDAGALWHQAVNAWLREEYPELVGRDLATLEELRPGFDMHHIVEASSLWNERVDGVRVGELELTVLGVTAWAIWHPYAGFPVNVSTHGDQTSRMKKIPAGRLLAEHLAFVAALDDLVGVGWASARITRAYS